MLPVVELVLHGVFLLGVIAAAARGREMAEADRSAALLKLVVYYVVVQGVLCSLLQRIAFVPVAVLVVFVSGWEIVRLTGPSPTMGLFALLGAGFLACAFAVSLDRIMFCFFIVAVMDFSSEIGGRTLGRRRLVPRISPNKTVEGLAAGIAASFSAASIAAGLLRLPMLEVLLFCCLVVPAAVGGDLLASWVKRRHRVKDFGSIMPGHGGVLDRFDSFLMSGCIVFLYSLISAPA